MPPEKFAPYSYYSILVFKNQFSCSEVIFLNVH